MKNSAKMKVFLEVASELNTKLNSVPVLYGSLGLSKCLNASLNTDDIDILIEDSKFTSARPALIATMESLGFKLIDPKEHKFSREGLEVGLASDGDLLSFCGVNPATLEVIDGAANYRILTLPQFLATYKASSLDGYRKNTHQKDDSEKIRLIESAIQNS